MKTILSQAAKAEAAKAEGATTIPKGSRFQVEPKRGASQVDEEIVWTCRRRQEGKWERFTRNILGFCQLQRHVYMHRSTGSSHAYPVHRRAKRNQLIERTHS